MKKDHNHNTLELEENEGLLWESTSSSFQNLNKSTKVNNNLPRFVVEIGHYLQENQNVLKKVLVFAILIPVYFLSAGFIAIVNKATADGPVEGERGFKCPLTMTSIQLTFVSIALILWSVFKHFFIDKRIRKTTTTATSSANLIPQEPSWVFGPHFLFKLKTLATLGVVFGLKLGLMNWGLTELGLGQHFLLQAASLFWTVLFAWIFLKEKPTPIDLSICFCVILGETFVSYEVGVDMGISAVKPLLLNLIPPLLLGVLLILLRKATKELMSTSLGMTSVELTGIKLALSALTVIPFAFLFEGFLVGAKAGAQPFWEIYQQSSFWIPFLLLASIVLTLIFQVTLTSLSYLAGAITVGVASEVKVVVQVLLLAVVPGRFNKRFETSWTHIVGTILVLGSAVAFSILKYFKLKKKSFQKQSEREEQEQRNRENQQKERDQAEEPLTIN